MNSIQVIDALSYVDTKTMAEKISRRPDKFFVMMKTNLKLIEQLRLAENEKRWKQLREQHEKPMAKTAETAASPYRPITPDNGE